MGELQYSEVQVAAQSNLTAIAPYMFWLMFRNVASDGFVFEDPENAHALSRPGCVLASPSWENSATHVIQDYVYNWTRDAAIVAIELAAGTIPTSQPLIDYVQFAQICQNSGGRLRSCVVLDQRHAAELDRSDRRAGPADAGDPAAVRPARRADADRGERRDRSEPELPAGRLSRPDGQSLGGGVRRLVLRARRAAAVLSRRSPANTLGIPVPAWLGTAIPGCRTPSRSHWNGQYYQSLLPAPTDKRPTTPTSTSSWPRSTAPFR